MNLSWDKLKDPQKIGLIALVFLLIYVNFYVFFLKKHLIKLKSLVEDLRKVEQEIATKEDEIKNSDLLKEKYLGVLSEIEKAEKMIYKENQTPQATQDITSKSAKGLTVNFSLIEPGKIKDSGRYKALPLKINFRADYFSLLSYFARLSSNLSLNLDRVVITPSKKNKNLVEAQISGEIFLLPLKAEETGVKIKESPEAKPAPGAGGKLTNPFTSPVSEIRTAAPAEVETPVPTLVLSGIWKGEVTKAIINGKIVKQGDLIAGCRVKKILENRVVLDFNGSELVLNIK